MLLLLMLLMAGATPQLNVAGVYVNLRAQADTVAFAAASLQACSGWMWCAASTSRFQVYNR
jgi:hypothetical protein